MAEMEWVLENIFSVRRRAYNHAHYLTLTIPTNEGTYLYPVLAVNLAIQSLMLWSYHFLQNGECLGGEKTAYFSEGRRYFKRAGAQVPPLYTEMEKAKPLTLT